MSDLISRFAQSSYLSSAVGFENLLFLSGQVPVTVDAAIDVQTQEVLAKIDRVLADGGSSRDKILFAMIWLKDIRQRNTFNQIWEQWVGDMPSSRACVQAELADSRMLVEIAVVAARL